MQDFNFFCKTQAKNKVWKYLSIIIKYIPFPDETNNGPQKVSLLS